jgi:hypothetical protein
MNEILKPGDQVTRQKYLDDGTWEHKGDECLARSPLLHGVVISRFTEPRTRFNREARKLLPMVKVLWNETGEERNYFLNGVDKI